MAVTPPPLSYEQVLSALGAFLDAQHVAECVLCEVTDGYIGRWRLDAVGDHVRVEGRGFSHLELHALIYTSREQMQDPYGYEGIFGSLGRQLDRANARTVTIVELPQGLLLSFFAHNGGTAQMDRQDIFYDAAGLRTLIDSLA